MKLIIAGGRDFDNYERLKEVVGMFDVENLAIVSGTARGADQLGERYAKEHSLTIHRYPADWDNHGRSAGYKRNELMADNADTLLAFWDGKSKGTKHMIDTAIRKGLQVVTDSY